MVVGGGASGLMASISFLLHSPNPRRSRLIILDRNPVLGAKLRITGGGRCNVTNVSHPDTGALSSQYRPSPPSLPLLASLPPRETLAIFEKIAGIEFQTEEHGRVFPRSNSAEAFTEGLVSSLFALARDCGEFQANLCSEALSIGRDGAVAWRPVGAGMAREVVVRADHVVVAVGGSSRPDLGCTGDAVRFARLLGEAAVERGVSLAPLVCQSGSWVRALAGVTVRDVVLAAADRKGRATPGSTTPRPILFTHQGLSGPAALALSGSLTSFPVKLAIDFAPAVPRPELDARLEREFRLNRSLTSSLKLALPTLPLSVHSAILARPSGEAFRQKTAEISRAQRGELVSRIKAMEVVVEGKDERRAIASCGGLDARGLGDAAGGKVTFVGDALDFDKPTGGYSLQLAWSTGWRAGKLAAEGSGLSTPAAFSAEEVV